MLKWPLITEVESSIVFKKERMSSSFMSVYDMKSSAA